MGNPTDSANKQLQQVQKELMQECARLEVLGRGLSPEERRRIEALRVAIDGITKALEALTSIAEPLVK